MDSYAIVLFPTPGYGQDSGEPVYSLPFYSKIMFRDSGKDDCLVEADDHFVVAQFLSGVVGALRFAGQRGDV